MKASSIFIATVLLAAVCRAPAAAQPARTSGPYLISVGDVLDVIVWRNKELSLTVTVRPDGWISYPIVGELHVQGLTPTELQTRVEKGLAESVASPAVAVIVTRVAGFKVSILGKVRQPGRFDVLDSATVLDILALAGGPNDYADPDQMYVLRRPRLDAPEVVRIPVRYSSGVNPGARDSPNIQVRPGDIIVVP